MKSSTKIWISVGLTLSVVAAAIWFFFGQHGGFNYGYGHGYMPYGYGMMTGNGMGFTGGGMGLVMILFWVIVLVAVAFIISGILGGRSINQCETTPPAPDALEILKRRYARGEIDQNEYEQKKRELA